MTMLAIDRSTPVQSVALATDGVVQARVLAGEDARSADWPVRVRDFLASFSVPVEALDRIVVGTGPGSFAGIRAALAFAQGLQLGIDARRGPGTCSLVGMPSALALARETGNTAVVGDARRDKLWLALYAGVSCVRTFSLYDRTTLFAAVPEDYVVVTPDADRIGDFLGGAFGTRFLGGATPLAGRLAEIALAHPACCTAHPLPTYLSPAVRPAGT